MSEAPKVSEAQAGGHPILVPLEISEQPSFCGCGSCYSGVLPDPKDVKTGPIVAALREASASVGEAAIERWGEWDIRRCEHELEQWGLFPADPRQGLELEGALAAWERENPPPDLEAEYRRAAWLGSKARQIAQCGKDLLALVRKNPELGQADRELSWSRCRVRGCPWCGWVDAKKVQVAASGFAQKMESMGFELRVVHLTLPGDPRDSLRERSDRFKAAIKTLRNWGRWRSQVQLAVLFHEAPWNIWKSTRLAPVGINAGEAHHWHWHVHALIWFRVGEAWPATDQWGRYGDGKWSGVALKWYEAAGLPVPEDPEAGYALRLEVAEPYAPEGAAETAAVHCAASYAAKYASKGTGDFDADGAAAAHLVKWIEESAGLHFQQCYGKRWLKSLWVDLRDARGTEKPVVVGLLDELERRAERWEQWCAETGATLEYPKVERLQDQAELMEAEEGAAFVQLTEAGALRAKAFEVIEDRDCWLVLAYFNRELGIDDLDRLLSTGSLQSWLEGRRPSDWSEIVARRTWSDCFAPWRVRQRKESQEEPVRAQVA